MNKLEELAQLTGYANAIDKKLELISDNFFDGQNRGACIVTIEGRDNQRVSGKDLPGLDKFVRDTLTAKKEALLSQIREISKEL